MVDPYEPFVHEGRKNDYSKCFNLAKKKLLKFNEKIEFSKKKSEEAVEYIPDDIDFVYIDGNHDYDFVKKDIELYYNKVRKNGIIGGHDISRPGVLKSFIEFILIVKNGRASVNRR